MGAFHDWESAFLYLKGRENGMETFFYRLIHWFSTIDFLNWFRKYAGEKPREARRGAWYARYTIARFEFGSFLMLNKSQNAS